MDEISPARAIGIVLGARAFPNSPQLAAPESLGHSADGIVDYLRGSFGLPDGHLLNLFDSPEAPDEMYAQIVAFLDRHEDRPRDVIVYYVGHGHIPHENDLFLAIRRTRQRFLVSNTLRVKDLGDALRNRSNRYRIYMILDCCFSGAAVAKLLSVSALQATVTMTERAFPSGGLALLCSTSASEVGWAPEGDRYTLFSGALLDVLQKGEKNWGSRMSLQQIGAAVRDRVASKNYGGAGLPEVHSPDKRQGDVATVGLFPNPARRLTEPAREIGLREGLTIAHRHLGQLKKVVKELQRVLEGLPSPLEMGHFNSRLILERDGSASLERECLSITARHSVTDLEIPYRIGVSRGELGPVVVEDVAGSNLRAKFVETLRETDPETGATRVEGFVRIAGQLSETTSFVGYRIRQQIGKSFYVTKEDVDRAYAQSGWPTEYFGSDPQFLVHKLRVSVDFPPEFVNASLAARPVVFFGETELLDEEETERVASAFKIVGRTATLDVEQPRRGNQYVLAWMPPPASPVVQTD